VVPPSFIHEVFVTAAGAIGGALAIGLFYHLVRCLIFRKHWREFASSLLGVDGVQLAESGAMLQAGHARSDDQSIPILDEELSVRLGLPPAPPDDDDDDDDDDEADEHDATDKTAASGTAHDKAPVDGEDPASEPATEPIVAPAPLSALASAPAASPTPAAVVSSESGAILRLVKRDLFIEAARSGSSSLCYDFLDSALLMDAPIEQLMDIVRLDTVVISWRWPFKKPGT
jgi:hypothetical protein